MQNIYSVESGKTILQELKELREEVRGKGFYLMSTESVEGVSDLNRLFGGLRVPHGVEKVTCRVNYSGAMTDMVFRLGVISEYDGAYFGRFPNDMLVKIAVSFDTNGGVIQDISRIA